MILPAQCGWQKWPYTRCCWRCRSASPPAARRPAPAPAAAGSPERLVLQPRIPKPSKSCSSCRWLPHPASSTKTWRAAISQLMAADICLLALPQLNDQYLIFPGGYNLITDSRMDGFSLEQRKIPALVSAMNSSQPLHLPAGSAAPELQSLASRPQGRPRRRAAGRAGRRAERAAAAWASSC